MHCTILLFFSFKCRSSHGWLIDQIEINMVTLLTQAKKYEIHVRASLYSKKQWNFILHPVSCMPKSLVYWNSTRHFFAEVIFVLSVLFVYREYLRESNSFRKLRQFIPTCKLNHITVTAVNFKKKNNKNPSGSNVTMGSLLTTFMGRNLREKQIKQFQKDYLNDVLTVNVTIIFFIKFITKWFSLVNLSILQQKMLAD